MRQKSHNTPRGPRRRHLAACAAAISIAGLTIGGIGTAHAAASIDDIILLVGSDESERVVNWYATDGSPQEVQVGPAATFPSGATTVPGIVVANTANGGYSGHAVLTGLAPDTEYTYRVGSEGVWSSTYSFTTQAFDGDFDFLFFGDPQIGSSGDVAKDGAGWDDTLTVALAANPDAELLVSGGDQVEHANTETEWTAFLGPDELRETPWVATIGNHDVGGKAYEQHLWTPNTDRSPSHYGSSSSTISGGDYWFVYKDVLFIDLNSNAYSASGQSGVDADDAHIDYVTQVITDHGADAKYTVLVYHHAIYSPADHANDADNQKRRQDFPAAFSDLGVDLVLQGHDHSYSRSYVIDGGADGRGVKQNPDEQPAATSVVQGPGGVIYVTANSASGSKYYDLTNPNTSLDPFYGADPLNPDNHWANSVENQEHVRTYVKVSVADDLLTVENVRAGTCAAPNAAVERGNVSWCGPDNGSSAALPVGSIVDRVEIHPNDNGPEPVVPESPITFLLPLSGVAAIAAGGLILKRRTQRPGTMAA